MSTLEQGSRTRVPVNLKANDYLRAQLEEFATCILSGTRPEVGAKEAIAPLAVIHAAIKSNRERRIVPIDEVLASAAPFAASSASNMG